MNSKVDLSGEDFYLGLFLNPIEALERVYRYVYPVPADCPVYLLAIGRKKESIWWDCYQGNPEWCSKCLIYHRYCDGKNISISKKSKVEGV